MLSLLLIHHWPYLLLLVVHIQVTFPCVTFGDLLITRCSLLFLLLTRVLRIWESIFYPQVFLSLYSSSRFGTCTTTTYLHQGFPKSQQFNIKGCRASYCNSKHRLSSIVCLNHTTIKNCYVQYWSLFKHVKFVDEIILEKKLATKK